MGAAWSRQYARSYSAGGTLSVAEWGLRWFQKATQSAVASSTASTLRQRGRRWISSALKRPFTVSARALS
jgi:hypothetical protein